MKIPRPPQRGGKAINQRVTYHWVVRSAAMRGEVCTQSHPQVAAENQFFISGIARKM